MTGARDDAPFVDPPRRAVARSPAHLLAPLWLVALALDLLPYPWGEEILARLFWIVGLIRPRAGARPSRGRPRSRAAARGGSRSPRARSGADGSRGPC